MKKIIVAILFLLICNNSFSNDFKFFKKFYPIKPFIYFLNPELKKVTLINNGQFGTFEDNYFFESRENSLFISNESGETIEVFFKDDKTYAVFNDSRGLWQTYELNYNNGLLDSFIWEHRLMVEGRDEPLMIKEENLFQYNDDGILINHGNSSKYSSRVFNYTEGKLDQITNTIGNGEKEWNVNDIITYTSATDYITKPSSELKFYSLHYPTMNRKEHTEVTNNGTTIITDTYYYNKKVYYETVQEWQNDQIIKISTYVSVSDNTTTFTFSY